MRGVIFTRPLAAPAIDIPFDRDGSGRFLPWLVALMVYLAALALSGALVLERTSTCILCHSGPFPEEKFQGDLAPSLAGAGHRWSEGQLRLRLVDASRLNPGTIMPSYYRVEGLDRVAPAWRGKPILSAEQIEDIVAYLASLRE